MLKIMFYLLLIQVTLAAAWLLVPTSAFITNTGYRIDGRHLTFLRSTPYGTVSGRYRSEIVLLRDNFECRSEWLPATFQQTERNSINYTLGEWATECLERNEPYVYRGQHQVVLFGVIPLRVSQTLHIEDGK